MKCPYCKKDVEPTKEGNCPRCKAHIEIKENKKPAEKKVEQVEKTEE